MSTLNAFRRAASRLAMCSLIAQGALLAAGKPLVASEETAESNGTALETAALMAELDAELTAPSLESQGPSLNLYGFADFSFHKFFVNPQSPVRTILNTQSSFSVGNFNLYLSSNLGSGFRSLAEVRFSFLPNGDRKVDGDSLARSDTTVRDYTNLSGEVRTGSVLIQRVWLEYKLHKLVTIRAGNWFTPYGIWNVDHGSPTIIPVIRPYVIALQLMPERQTGLQAYGSQHVSDSLSLGYNVGLSNGRGPVDNYADLDSNKAVTLRLNAVYRSLGKLDLGASLYVGRFTDLSQSLVSADSGLRVEDRLRSQYDELTWGLDARFTLGGFHSQAEFLFRQARFTEEGREARTAVEFQPDDRALGGYLIVGYRWPWLGLMPYVTGEYFRVTNIEDVLRPPKEDVITDFSFGLNARPTATVTLKAEVNVALFPGAPPGSAFAYDIWALQAQTAWAF